MWWLGHLFLIFCVFGLGFATREVIIAYRALEQWFVYGSEDPANFQEKPKHKTVQATIPPNDPFSTMQAKVDNNKLAELKSLLKK
jgi:hypothetical protein